MYRIIDGSTQGLADVEAFINALNDLDGVLKATSHPFFDSRSKILVTRAPGRLDVMGGIADYSGSLVLQLPIREATLAALQQNTERTIQIVTFVPGAQSEPARFEMSLDELQRDGQPVEYPVLRDRFQQNSAQKWAAYVVGCFLVLSRELDAAFEQGSRILIWSKVPQGSGVSSSAAIEVSVMQAIARSYGISVSRRQLALLCQKVENLVVGAPCGVMDQMASACGESNRLLALLCQPAELQGMVQVPQQIEFWGLDSGVHHSVSGEDYVSVRVGAFMGYRILAELAGLDVVPEKEDGHVRISDPKWKGYLANVTPEEFERLYANRLPSRLAGAEFLQEFDGTTDSVTQVHPDRTYAVLRPTAHPVFEHARVRRFRELLEEQPDHDCLGALGALMYESHASYSACGLGSSATDLLVDLVKRVGPERGLFGAKITGGGSGGTVAVLGRRGANKAIQEVAHQYEVETGQKPYVFSGSSPGAAAFGHITLQTPHLLS